MTNNRVFNTTVISFDGQDFKEVMGTLVYPGDGSSNGLGQFIDSKAYDQYIHQTYKDELDKLSKDPTGSDVSDALIIFEVGKTIIQMILAQQDCEGIRLIQVNVKNQHDDGFHKSFIVQGITKVKDMAHRGIASAVQGLDDGDDGGILSEEIHGFCLKDSVNAIKRSGHELNGNDIEKFIHLLWSGSENA